MSFKSYISVDFPPPEDFYEWKDDTQEKYWNIIYNIQTDCEEAYCKMLDKQLKKLGCDDIDVDIESK